VRPEVSYAGLICRIDQCFQRQRLPYTYTCWIKTVKSVRYISVTSSAGYI